MNVNAPSFYEITKSSGFLRWFHLRSFHSEIWVWVGIDGPSKQYVSLTYCLQKSPTNSKHCNLPHFVKCKGPKPTNHVEPDMKEENRKETYIIRRMKSLNSEVDMCLLI